MSRRVLGDFSEMQEPVDTGAYRTRLEKVSEPVESQKTPGTHYVTVSGIIADPETEENGRSLMGNLMINGKGSGMWFNFLGAFGIPEDDRQDVDVESLLGLECIWRVTQERSINKDTGEDYGIRSNVKGFSKIRD